MISRITLLLLLLVSSGVAVAEKPQGGSDSIVAVLTAKAVGLDVLGVIPFAFALPHRAEEMILAGIGLPQSQPRVAREARYAELFYNGHKKIYSNDFVGAKELFQELYHAAHRDGYRNLTSYSYVLLDIAKRFAEEGKLAEARYLAREAVLLSPEDGRVHFAAMAFGFSDNTSTLSYISKGVALLFRYPSVVLPFVANIFLAGLAAASVSFLLVCIIQIALYHRVVHRVLFRRAPRIIQVFVGPLCLLGILVLPLFAGMLPALLAWSFLLSLNINHARWVVVMVSALTIFWGLGIKIVSVTNENVQVKLNHALENVTSGNFVPYDKIVLKKALEKFAHDPHVVFANGVLVYLEGDLKSAANFFKAVLSIAGKSSPLQGAAYGNLGLIALHQGAYDEAATFFDQAEGAGISAFEMHRNRSLLSLAAADIEGHRTHYAALKSDFDTKLRDLEAREGSEPQPLLFLVPTAHFMKNFFRPPLDKEVRAMLITREQHLAEQLMIGGTPERISIAGIISLLLSLVLVNRVSLRRFLAVYGTVMVRQNPSLVWLPIPGGRFIAGRYPVTGIVTFTLFLMLVMLHSGLPARLLAVFPFPIETGNGMLVLAGIVFLLGIAGSFMVDRFSQKVA